MKLLKYTLYAFVGLFLLQSCAKKELEDDIISEPNFYVHALVDGEALSLIGGLDDVYVSPSYFSSDNGLPVFNTSFSNVACAECHESLIIELIGADSGPSEDIFDVLPTGPYLVSDFINESNSGFFTVESQSTNLFVNIINQTTSESFIIEANDSFPFLIDGLYTLLTISEFGTISYNYSYTFIVENGQICGSAPQISIADNIFSFSGDFANEFYMVSINGVDTELMPGEEFPLGIISGPDLEIIIHYMDDENCFSDSFWNLPNQNLVSFESDITLEPTVIENDYEELSVKIKYTSPDGIEYVSRSENTEGLFTINSLELDNNNPANQEAYLIDFNSNIELRNVENESEKIDLIIQEAIIPVVWE